jgi:hypothetical protein
MLAQAGVELYVPGKVALVPLSELEAKAKPLWEGIKPRRSSGRSRA